MEISEANDYAESVFNESEGMSEAPEGALESWDDVPVEGEGNVEESTEGDNRLDAIVSDKSENTDFEPSGESLEQEDSEATDEEDGDSVEDSKPDEETEGFEIPEALREKGLTLGEDGSVGKIVKVDGEEQFVSLEELGNDYSGQKALQRRFTELDRENKSFKSEVDTVNSYVNTFREKAQSGDMEAAIKYLGELGGIPAYQIERQLMQQLTPKIQELSQMTPTELQAKYVQEENEYLKGSIESERSQYQAQQAQVELQQEIVTIRETHGIDDGEWEGALNFLREHEKAIRDANPDIVMDANFVADYIRDERAYNNSVSAFEAAGVNPSESGNLVNELQRIAYENPDFTQEDLVELVNTAQRSAVTSKVSEGLGKRVEKHNQKPKQKQTQTQQQTTPEEDSLLEDIFG